MEIGSFLELQFSSGLEYFNQTDSIARLNSGRAAIYHACRVCGCSTIWLPYYQCDTVRDFLKLHDINIKYYFIDKDFNSINLFPNDDEAVLLVNYYGIMSYQRIKDLAKKYCNVIIDNSQAFFAKPLDNCLNVYSARKFVGVPDGAYVIGKNADFYVNEYPQGYSSDTSLFLLKRIEYGCEGETYKARMINEHRIDSENVMRMSKLTKTILDATDYNLIIRKRKENFKIACKLFSDINAINPLRYFSDDCVPMVYPLVIENENAINILLENKHFQGHWWSYLLEELDENRFEYWLSKYIIPITIDQRYGEKELIHLRSLLNEFGEHI